jgi:hypothetical protein
MTTLRDNVIKQNVLECHVIEYSSNPMSIITKASELLPSPLFLKRNERRAYRAFLEFVIYHGQILRYSSPFHLARLAVHDIGFLHSPRDFSSPFHSDTENRFFQLDFFNSIEVALR